MVSQKTAKDFLSHFRKGKKLNVSTVMKALKVSRPTATNAISTMLQRKKIKPIFQIGDPHKWYQVR